MATISLISSSVKPSRWAWRTNDSNVVAIDAVLRRGASGRGHNPVRLVEAERLPAHAASSGNLTDQQAVSSHSPSLNPAPWGKVKGSADSLTTLALPCEVETTEP
jgi:hypothetical protein